MSSVHLGPNVLSHGNLWEEPNRLKTFGFSVLHCLFHTFSSYSSPAELFWAICTGMYICLLLSICKTNYSVYTHAIITNMTPMMIGSRIIKLVWWVLDYYRIYNYYIIYKSINKKGTHIIFKPDTKFWKKKKLYLKNLLLKI